MKSTLERFKEDLMKKGFTIKKDDESKKMDSIVEFLMKNKEVHEQIMNTATKTIKTIQPRILFEDFKIAIIMIEAVVANAIYVLIKNGYIEIKKGVK